MVHDGRHLVTVRSALIALFDHQRYTNQGTDQDRGLQPTRNQGHDEAIVAYKYHCIISLSLLDLGNEPLGCFSILGQCIS